MKDIFVAPFTYLELFLFYSDIIPRHCELAHRSEQTKKFNRFPKQKEWSRLDVFVSELEDIRN